MNRIAGNITSSIISKLSAEQKWYTTKELLATGLPVFVVEKIRLDLEQNLLQSLLPPETLWADLESSASKKAWDNYISTIKNEVVIPGGHVTALVEKAVDHCLKLAVKPRNTIPEILFRKDDTVKQSVIEERSAEIFVNGHLASALIRYLHKKEKSEITIVKAREVIKIIDDKLVEGYHPLNWKELIAPIFAISGGTASTELIADFFDDKEIPVIADKFRKLDKDLTDTEFIEFISSADLIETGDSLAELPDISEQMQEESDSDINEESTLADSELENELDSEKPIISVSDEDEIPAEEPEEKNKDQINIQDQEEKETGLNDLFSTGDDIHEDDETDIEFDTSFDFPAYDENDSVEDHTEPMSAINPESEEKFENIKSLYDENPETDATESEIEDEEVAEQGNDTLAEVSAGKQSVEDHKDNEETLMSRFVLDDPTADDEPAEPVKKIRPRTIYDELHLIREENKPGTIKSLFDDLEGDESQSYRKGDPDDRVLAAKQKEPDSVTGKSTELHDKRKSDVTVTEPDNQKSAGSDTEVPMWKSFLDRGDVVNDDTPFALDDSEDDEDLLDEDGFIETPIYDFTEDDEPFKEDFDKISNWLADERERFIDEIFGGSEIAYDIALAEIINHTDWKKASRFLERDIFTRNRIDLYSEVAVDFTDRLHTFFIEYKP
jgi:hypothetical protein